ncbi:MAG: DUF1273 family protein [Clostridia bacterium]|nr:DUF1273 family protein [Clostridia bacterium]
MNKASTVVFIGHNDCYGVSSERLTFTITEEIKKGAINFLSGGQGGFDRLVASTIYKLKEQYPHIKNILVIPYPNFTVFDNELFDEIIYPQDFEKYHYKSAIPARNRYMVKNSYAAICFITHNYGGAAKTFEYAKRKGLHIYNISNKGYR